MAIAAVEAIATATAEEDLSPPPTLCLEHPLNVSASAWDCRGLEVCLGEGRGQKIEEERGEDPACACGV